MKTQLRQHLPQEAFPRLPMKGLCNGSYHSSLLACLPRQRDSTCLNGRGPAPGIPELRGKHLLYRELIKNVPGFGLGAGDTKR